MTNIPSNHWLRTRPIVHRGVTSLKSKIVGNTLEACILAKNEGLPIELDIRMTKYKKVILVHGYFVKFSDGELKHFRNITDDDIKSRYLYESNCKLVELKTVLKEIDGKVPLLIEIKYQGDTWRVKSLIREVSKTLSNYKGEYAIHSFYPNIAKVFKKEIPNAIVGVILPLFEYFPDAIKNMVNKIVLNRCKYDFVCYDIRHFDVDVFELIKSKNVPYIFWVIDNKKEKEFARTNKANIIFAKKDE